MMVLKTLAIVFRTTLALGGSEMPAILSMTTRAFVTSSTPKVFASACVRLLNSLQTSSTLSLVTCLALSFAIAALRHLPGLACNHLPMGRAAQMRLTVPAGVQTRCEGLCYNMRPSSRDIPVSIEVRACITSLLPGDE